MWNVKQRGKWRNKTETETQEQGTADERGFGGVGEGEGLRSADWRFRNSPGDAKSRTASAADNRVVTACGAGRGWTDQASLPGVYNV